MGNDLLQLLFIFGGIILVIISFFRPKKASDIEDMIERMFEDFIMQIDLENEDMLNKIKQTTQNTIPYEIASKITIFEQKLDMFEKELYDIKSIKDETPTLCEVVPAVNQKYIEVLKFHNEGYGIEDIVDKTSISHAEVKFILELSKRDNKYV